jgi:hypothetical protein
MMSSQKRDWESFLLFWILVLLGIALLIFGHHDPRQVPKMRIIGAFLLCFLGLLRWITGYGKFSG